MTQLPLEYWLTEKDVKQYIHPHCGEVLRVETVDKGVVHFVYRITGTRQRVYIKIRGSNFSKVPQIKCRPDEILYEKRAIELLHSIEPESFPFLLEFIEHRFALVMSDVTPQDETLESLFDQGAVSTKHIIDLAQLIKRTHVHFAEQEPVLRPGDEEQAYHNNLRYRLGVLNLFEINELIDELIRQDRQLIFGDLSPKNIGVNNGRITMFDLEQVHIGNPIFDVGFLLSHIVLHTLEEQDTMFEFVSTFLNGMGIHEMIRERNWVLNRIIIGTILYRLENRVIPYNLTISKEILNAVSSQCHLLLSKSETLENILYRLVSSMK
jgi:hypothetical protein